MRSTERAAWSRWGSPFAYAVGADGTIPKKDLFRWEHETDGRPWYAGHLARYRELRLSEEE